MRRATNTAFDGVGLEAQSLLRAKNISSKALGIVARMNPARQAEVARLMIAADCFSAPYLRALIGATERSLVVGARECPRIPMRSRQRKEANQEIRVLSDQLARLSILNGSDVVALLVSCRYAERLLTNQRIRRYLERKWPAICEDLEDLVKEHRTL